MDVYGKEAFAVNAHEFCWILIGCQVWSSRAHHGMQRHPQFEGRDVSLESKLVQLEQQMDQKRTSSYKAVNVQGELQGTRALVVTRTFQESQLPIPSDWPMIWRA
ncbi:hypothetical protein CFAM422_011814 [Trichoderma lentiforme]|uniref:Uncharacterized protein n=1 Tax=Trichoderma lentiforme TaxID=1567552 RepID=A0A9P4X398_9HYPO|nr:hypothetical protein CFAM422_011814 [Trichoderma lentiforme]